MKRDPMRRILPFLVATVLVVLTGVAHGIWTGRWVVSHELADSVILLQNVPMQIGDWKAEGMEIDPHELRMGKIVGYLKRRYTNVSDGTSVSMLIVSGLPGPISVHTPDICFEGAGYQLLSTPTKLTTPYGPGPETADFMWSDFSKKNAPTPMNLRIFWSWNGGGVWRTPDSPRVAHARFWVIYKLYVLHETTGRRDTPAEDLALRFAKVLLPEVDKALAAGHKGKGH